MTSTTYPDQATTIEDLLVVLRAEAGAFDEDEADADDEDEDDDEDEREAAGAGEDGHLTALDHGLQCAAVLRGEHPDGLELQVAGLVHDIGHRLQPGAPELHGVVGGRYVAGLLGDRVAALVELHVDAKRFLVKVEPSYRAHLSRGSAQTLIAQGEALSDAEVVEFAAKRHAADAVVLRRADERAKVPGRPVAPLEAWFEILERVASAVA